MQKNSLHTFDKNKLQDVVLMRFIVVVFLLFCHSFAIHTNSWKSPTGGEIIPAYFWLGKFVYSAMLETFVFISGYVLGLQISRGKFKYNFSFIAKKAKRLIIPALVFSIFWALLYYPYTTDTLLKIVRNIGVAHMWFLPMLFWCFVSTVILKWFKVGFPLLLALFFINFVSILNLPFGISLFFKYAFFFYWGIYLFFVREKVLQKMCKWKIAILIGLLYVSFFVISTVFLQSEWYECHVVDPKFGFVVATTLRLIYSTLGVLFIYLLANKILEKSQSVPFWIASVADISFAIYIIHQFVLKAIYYYTPLPEYVSAYTLPWIGLFITATSSIIISKVILKTHIGRALIG